MWLSAYAHCPHTQQMSLCPFTPGIPNFKLWVPSSMYNMASGMAMHNVSTCTMPSRHVVPAPKIQGSRMMGLRSGRHKRP